MKTPETLCPHAYLPYPHSNAFLNENQVLLIQQGRDGWKIVAGSWQENEWRESDARTVVRLNAEDAANVHVMFDIALKTPRMALIYNQALYLLDPRESYTDLPKPLYTPANGTRLYSIPSINAAGSRAVILEEGTGISTIKEIDLARGDVRTLVEKIWQIGHVHFVPGNEEWIAFCHEGATETIPDRVWAWHAKDAPAGRCVFDQKSDDPKQFLNVGHERWGFTEASGLAVAYGCSPAGPRGLWQVFADGRPARQIFKNDRCWHCDISRDGRYALADTTGTWNLPGCGWKDDDKNRSILLIDVASGRHVVLGAAGGDKHPYHPHPVFSPDGRCVLFNTKRGDETAVMKVEIGDPAALFR